MSGNLSLSTMFTALRSKQDQFQKLACGKPRHPAAVVNPPECQASVTLDAVPAQIGGFARCPHMYSKGDLTRRGRGLQSDVMRLAWFPVMLVILGGAGAAQAPPREMFSTSATPVWDSLGDRKQVRIPSPNRTTVLLAEGMEQGDTSGVRLTLRRGPTTIWKQKFSPGVGIEIGWSPDSLAFFVTTSNAGLNGWYGTVVYLVNGGTVTKVDLSPAVLSEFGHPVKCGWQEAPNVAGVRWVVPSKRLLVTAEIMNHSNCDSFGTFRAYEVALPDGAIVKKYGQIETKRLFPSDLGWELVDAPDKCIIQPKSCWVTVNHPRTK